MGQHNAKSNTNWYMFQDVEVIALEDWDFLFYIAKLFLGSIKKNQKKFSTITSGTE